MQKDFEDFQSHAFELQTIANQNLKPEKIHEYLKIVNTQSGSDICRSTLNYIIVVLGKYLQIIVAYHIHKGDLDVVEEDFVKFNENYYKLAQIFHQVTGKDFLLGYVSEVESSRLESEGNSLEIECRGCAEKEDLIKSLEKDLKEARTKICHLEKN